jgi:hypothetical protein
MSATLITSLLLGGAAFATSVFGVVTQVRDRGRSVRKQEGDIKRIETNIELDETTRTRLAAEAAQINSDVAIAQQTWWREQFDAVRGELTVEQQRTRRLTKWANQHQEWDQRAWTLARQSDPEYPPPPLLDMDD